MDKLAPASGSLGSPYGQPMEQIKRVASALVILPPLLLFLYYAPQELFLMLILAVTVLCLREYFRLLALTHWPLCTTISYIVSLLLVYAAYAGGERWMSRVLSCGVAFLVLSTLVTSQSSPHRLLVLLHSVFGVLFIGWNLSHLMLLRSLDAGQWYVFFLCGIVWVGDTMAMYVGKSLGRHKLAPAVSPGKTWEGAIGGIVGGVSAAVFGARFFLPQVTLLQGVSLGLLVSVAAQISDLGESMIKRYAGVKDSGELIPGHGGLLDRIDSVLLAAPILIYALDFLSHTFVP